MTKRLRIGYVPLTDAALLHVAKAQHFAAARGVEIELVADSSWANIRDKLVVGHFDAAHMLAPAAIAVSLGIDQVEIRRINAPSTGSPIGPPAAGGGRGTLTSAFAREALDRGAEPRQFWSVQAKAPWSTTRDGPCTPCGWNAERGSGSSGPPSSEKA